MKEKKLTEGSQESGERVEGWKFGKGTWLDSGPSSGFGSGLEVPITGRFWGATTLHSGIQGST